MRYNTNMKRKGIIFDLDGTLVNTMGDIAASMNQALKNRGFPELTADEYRKKVGWGIKRLTFLSLPEEERQDETVNNVAADAVEIYRKNPLIHSILYPGIPELISIVKNKKLKTAVLTNKPDPVAQLVIAGLFPPGSFDIVQGEMPGKPRKPDPASVWELMIDLNLTPADVIFMGDSEVDMETAVLSGCFALGVSWGYRPRELLEKAGAKQIIEKPEELLELL